MKRIVSVLAVLAIMVTMMVATGLPAFADQGGVPHLGSCGLGEGKAHRAIANPLLPGASELARVHPTVCPGNP